MTGTRSIGLKRYIMWVYTMKGNFRDGSIAADCARKLMDSKTEAERQQSLSKKHWRDWLKEIGILQEYLVLSPHSFVTIRLLKGQSPDVYKAQLESLKELDWVSGGEAVFEGGGTENPHIHLLIKEKRHKANTIKVLSRRFKVQPHMVNFKSSDDAALFATRTAYLRGDKTNEKSEKVQADLDWRTVHGIPHLIQL